MARLFSILLILSLSVAGACQSDRASSHAEELRKWTAPNGKVKVLSTIGMIDDLVRQVGGEHVDALLLIKGELDPHSYQPVKGDDEKLAFAQVVFCNGLGLEHGPGLQKHLLENPWAFSLGDQLKKENPGLIIAFRGQDDPHIWMDISLWVKIVPQIAEALSLKDPAHAQDFRANGAKLQSEMMLKHEELKRLLQSIPDAKRYLVTSHDAFNYFTRAYLATEEERSRQTWEKRFAAPEGLAPESQISARDIQEILEYLDKYRIETIFSESNVSRDSIRKIMDAGKQKGLNVRIANVPLYADAMGGEGSPGETYLKMMEHNAAAIYRHLEDEGKQVAGGGNDGNI